MTLLNVPSPFELAWLTNSATWMCAAAGVGVGVWVGVNVSVGVSVTVGVGVGVTEKVAVGVRVRRSGRTMVCELDSGPDGVCTTAITVMVWP